MSATRRRKLVLAGCGGCLLVALGALVVLVWTARGIGDAIFDGMDDFDPEQQPWTECRIPLPEDYGDLVFLRRHIHPFLAEYDRKVRFETKLANGEEAWLMVNTGGLTRINVHWYPAEAGEGPWVKLQDHWGEHLADIGHGTTSTVFRVDGHTFAGQLTTGDEGYGWVRNADGNLTARGGESKARDITGTGPAGTGTYLGRLDGTDGPVRFISAAESPEQPIEMID